MDTSPATTTAARRQRRLASHYLTSGQPSPRLSQTVALAAAALEFPFAQINIVDDARTHTISGFGCCDENFSIPREDSVCSHTVAAAEVIGIEDLRQDPRSRELPGVVAGYAASYLGVPIRGRESDPVGTLCVFDSEPRSINATQKDLIREYGAIIEDQLELIRRSGETRETGQPAPDELAHAIDNDRIVPWYQPIVDISTGNTVGFEALARWQHPTGGVVDPAEFVPLAEDSDLVLDLDLAVLRHALEDLKTFLRIRPDLRLSVNFSVRHLEVPDGVATIHRAVMASGVAPQTITVELTETRELTDPEQARAAVHQLRALGYGVVLDDFGTGWSSANWILRLPISGLKIDRSVTVVLGTPAGDAVARAVAALSINLGLNTVIEGIDTQAQAQQAAVLGLNHGQGYLWSRPLPAAGVAAWLT